jgi:hypothetical protein
MSFSNWLSQQNNIKFDYTPLKNSFLNAKKSYISSLHDTQMNVGSFNLERFFQKIESRTKNYPNQDKLLKALAQTLHRKQDPTSLAILKQLNASLGPFVQKVTTAVRSGKM